MIPLGTMVSDSRGCTYRVICELGIGGQGTVYEAAEASAGTPWVVKIMHPAMATADTVRRLETLVRMDLGAYSPALCAPVAMLSPSHGVGTIQRKAPGIPLLEVLAAPTYGLLEGLGIGIALARALAVLERLSVAHGDIGSANVMVERCGDHWRIYLIDFDNAVIPGAPPPTLVGHGDYAAPEVSLGRAPVGVEGDRYAFAVLLYEVLYIRHPNAPLTTAVMSPDEYLQAVLATVNSADAYVAACTAGLGIIQVPRLGLGDALAGGTLVEILPDFTCAPMPVSLIHGHGCTVPKRVQAVMKWIAQTIAPGLA